MSNLAHRQTDRMLDKPTWSHNFHANRGNESKH